MPAMAAPPAGASYGPNIRGANQAYTGPRTPAGPEAPLPLSGLRARHDAPRRRARELRAMTEAMKGHVLASGEVIGLGQVAPPAN